MPGRMALPKNINWVTFDVYGTLIDWETGIYDAFEKEAERDGFTIDRDELIPLFHEISREIEGGSYELYAEVLRRTAVEIAKRLGWPLEPSRSGFLPDSVAALGAVQGDQRAARASSSRSSRPGLISNIDDKLLGQTRRHIPHDFDLVVTAQQVRSYKPDPAHFNECARRIGGKKGWVHVASSYYHDVEPCVKAQDPGDLGQPQQGDARARPEEADRRGQEPPRGGQAARRSSAACGSSALHPDVLVVTVARLADDLHVVRAGDEASSIDSPVLPDELEVLPALLEQAGFPFSGLLATHADWDHLLGRLAFPEAALGVRRDDRGAADAPSPATAQRELRAFDDEHYVERPAPLSLGQVQALSAGCWRRTRTGTTCSGGSRSRRRRSGSRRRRRRG